MGSAIAYNVWQYFQVTHDIEFLQFYGAELMLDIALFWSSIANFNSERERYEIRGVMGPDEFHDGYPDAATPGLNNNAYTNVMAVWVLCRAMEVLDLLSDMRRAELTTRLGISAREIARWDDISRRMYVPFHDDGIISQFEGYDVLREFDWPGIPKAGTAISSASISSWRRRMTAPTGTSFRSRPMCYVVLSVFLGGAWRAVRRVWVIHWAAIRSRRTSPIMLHARLTAPRYAGWFIPGSWRVPTVRVR